MADETSLTPGNPPAPGSSPPSGAPAPPPSAITAQPMPMAPIPLDPAAKPKTAPAVAPKEAEQKDSFRELIETVVFVVVLVLMLKTFLAEAFVIPTGSMADTLLGYHHKVVCKECGYPNLVNASDEADPQGGNPQPVVSCQCQNCGATNHLDAPVPAPRGGQQ